MTTVLLATDGSQLASEALRRGLEVVETSGRLVLVTVAPGADPTLVVGGGHSGPVMSYEAKQQLLDAQDAEAERILAAAVAMIPSDNVETRLLHGQAGEEICRAAADLDADVIVIGTRGLGGLRRAVLGSVSDHVVRNAPCPVLTVTSD